jgi:hypothetical protein
VHVTLRRRGTRIASAAQLIKRLDVRSTCKREQLDFEVKFVLSTLVRPKAQQDRRQDRLGLRSSEHDILELAADIP